MSLSLETLAIVCAARPGDLYRSGRTLRAVASLGVDVADASGDSREQLTARLCSVTRPVWLLQSGTWPSSGCSIRLPHASASGRPLIAFGRICSGHDANGWNDLLRQTGGELRVDRLTVAGVPLASVWIESNTARLVGERVRSGATIWKAILDELSEAECNADAVRSKTYRAVHCDGLDVFDDPRRRVLQVITTLQRGGAERVALDIAVESPRFGVRSRIATLGSPTRGAFATPTDVLDVSAISARAERIEAVRNAALEWHADIVHAHLVRGEELAILSRSGAPVVATIHNARQGWPPGTETLQASDATMLVACAQSVEADLRREGPPIPVRTALNGIDFAPLHATDRGARVELRRRWGFGKNDFVLLALSNPRPQKRWELLPAVLYATQQRFAAMGIRRRARLVVAGETTQLPPVAAECVAGLLCAADKLGVASDIYLAGLIADVPGFLAAADLLICTSAYEGLSLAHLEAFAAGKPIVATDVGGTSEIAAEYSLCNLVAVNASASEYAETMPNVARSAIVDDRAHLSLLQRSSFSRFRMAERYAWLYDRAIGCRRNADRARSRNSASDAGILLIANNFATGGAQSSARRLLVALHQRGVRVRAAVVEEQPEHPTPGRRALEKVGIEVIALPAAGSIDPAAAVRELLERIDADPPDAVLFWNLIAEYKVLLADSLMNTRIVDVSPGEMFYTSFARYFARRRLGMPYRTLRDYGRRLDVVVVKYRAEAEQAAELGAPVRVIPNGIALPELHHSRSRNGQPLVLGTAARLSPQKKLEELIVAVRRAHRRMPPFVLKIAGRVEPGCEEYAQQLRALARGIPIEFVGEYGDPAEFLRALDLFVMISEPAGCPNASLEAMAHGLCVVATDFGGASEQIVDGKTGRLVPRGDCEELANAIVEVARNEPLRARLGRAARGHVAVHFSMEKMAEEYLRVCGLERGSRARPPEPELHRRRKRAFVK